MRVAVCCPYFVDSLVELLVQDLAPWEAEIHLWALESVVPSVAPLTRGQGRLGKFQAVNRLLPYTAGADLVLFIDDDVRLGPGFLPGYVAIVSALEAAVAQPALTADSYHSHVIVLQRKGCWARLTNFVESGPVVSMTRAFLDLVAPFPDGNPMGWGLDIHWSALAQGRGLRQAIVDACPVQHTLRPVAARYAMAEAWDDMERYLRERGLSWPRHDVLRAYPRIYERRAEYLDSFPAPVEATQHGAHSDAAQDLPLLWAVAALVRPEIIVEFGTRWGTSTRTLVHAAGQWGGRVVTVDPVDARPFLAGVPCEIVSKSTTELYESWSAPVSFLFLDTDPHSYAQTRQWLDTWVKTWLKDGGVAVFHDILTSRPEIRVAPAVRDWLREQSRAWRWREFVGSSGLGLLWRLPACPNFEALFALGRLPPPRPGR